MEEKLLEIKNLYFKYPDGTKALNNINLSIEKGKKICFLGVNGSGKSTLFLNLNGVLRPTSGSVFYKGNEVKYNRKDLKNLRKNIGIVFQDPESQLFSSSVYEEVAFGAMNLNLPIDEVKLRTDKALNDTNTMEYKKKPVHFLSYGQKKRVSIADILVMNPDIIILDEPTSSLDPKHSKDVVDIFNEINDKGITVILSTHDVDLAYKWADYIVVMKDGTIVDKGTPFEIFSKNDVIKDCYLEKPLILSVYEKLLQFKKISKETLPPKTQEELFTILKNI